MMEEMKAGVSNVRDFAYAADTKAHGGEMTDKKVEAATERVAGI
jgi:hypothetical protein